MGVHASTDPQSATNLQLPHVVYERYPGAASEPLPVGYRRHEPEKTVFYEIVRQHLETFLEQARLLTDGQGYPRFVEREFRRYLDCAQLSRGFARLRCPQCGFERLVAFSCKCHICTSCQARRMSDTAAALVDRLLPQAPYRQWVLSFPWSMRLALAYKKPLLTDMLTVFLRTVFAWQRRRGRNLGIKDGQTGSISFLQRLGGALNLNPHIHSILPDGLWVESPQADLCHSVDDRLDCHGDCTGSPLVFVPLPPPTNSDILKLTEKLADRLIKVAVGHLPSDREEPGEVDDEQAAMLNALASSLRAPLKLPDNPPSLPGVKVQPIATSGPIGTSGQKSHQSQLCASVKGFSLHAETSVAADHRAALERLCRYGLRPAYSVSRFSLASDGRVRYELRRPWPTSNGATELYLQPGELLRRLSASIPTPYTNMVRYHGVFANRSRFRNRLPCPPPPPSPPASCSPPPASPPPPPPGADHRAAALSVSTQWPAQWPEITPQSDTPTTAKRTRRLAWATLLKRVFHIDALRCPKCSTQMVVLAFLTDPQIVSKILAHLNLPQAAPPVAPARLDLFTDEGETKPHCQNRQDHPSAALRQQTLCSTARGPPTNP